MNWFKVNVRETFINEKGKSQKVTQTYILDAINYTDAETQIHQQYQHVTYPWDITGINDFKCTAIYLKGQDVTSLIVENDVPKELA